MLFSHTRTPYIKLRIRMLHLVVLMAMHVLTCLSDELSVERLIAHKPRPVPKQASHKLKPIPKKASHKPKPRLKKASKHKPVPKRRPASKHKPVPKRRPTPKHKPVPNRRPAPRRKHVPKPTIQRLTPVPTHLPTPKPALVPTPPTPVLVPTLVPTIVPTPTPTPVPTPVPTPTPIRVPTPVPTPVSTPTPTPVPTPVSTQTPTPVPTPVSTPTPTPVPTFTPIPVETDTTANDLCIMQAGMNDLYNAVTIANNYYFGIYQPQPEEYTYTAYDITSDSSSDIIEPFTGTGSCGTAYSSTLFNSRPQANATLQQLLDIGIYANAYLAQTMLNICISNDTCMTSSLDIVTNILNNNYAAAISTATMPYDAVSSFCINSGGQELSSQQRLPWIYVDNLMTLGYWKSVVDTTLQPAYLAQINISSVLPPNIENIEALLLLGVFFNSSTCDISFFNKGNLPTHLQIQTQQPGCSTSVITANNTLAVCNFFYNYSHEVYANAVRGVSYFTSGLFLQLLNACNAALPNNPCDIFPLSQQDFSDTLFYGMSNLLPSYSDIIDFGISAACDIAAKALNIYNLQSNCCSEDCSTPLCNEYVNMNLQTPYYGMCIA